MKIRFFYHLFETHESENAIENIYIYISAGLEDLRHTCYNSQVTIIIVKFVRKAYEIKTPKSTITQ